MQTLSMQVTFQHTGVTEELCTCYIIFKIKNMKKKSSFIHQKVKKYITC